MTGATKEKYIEAVGRRKTSVARVRLAKAAKHAVEINKRNLDDYFKTADLRRKVMDPFAKGEVPDTFSISVKVAGGGAVGQAEAIRHGITRALLFHDQNLRKKLKKAGFIKRDPRAKERRKFGLKKARKSPQWSKR